MRRLAYPAILALAAITLAGCQTGGPTPGTTPAATLRIGTLQTDDLLPAWVAEQQGFFADAQLQVTIETFQSAQEQIAAVTAGQIDAIMTDMVVGLQLTAAGTPMKFATVMQSAPAGVVAGADTGITTAAQLAGVETGCASPTILEYIYDRALKEAGVPDDQIKTTEIKKLPVRLQMLLSGQVKAAVLPWTLFQLAVSQGAVPVVGLDQSGPYTSTVLAFRQAWLAQPGADVALSGVLAAWDKAVGVINADPNAQRELLATKANLPAPLDTMYPVRQYPLSGPPPTAQVQSVIDWMTAKGYLTVPVAVGDVV